MFWIIIRNKKLNYKSFDLIYFEIFSVFILSWYHNTYYNFKKNFRRPIHRDNSQSARNNQQLESQDV